MNVNTSTNIQIQKLDSPIFLTDRISAYGEASHDAVLAANYLQQQKDKEEKALQKLNRAVERLESREEIMELWHNVKECREATLFTEQVAHAAALLMHNAHQELKAHFAILGN